MLDEEYLYCAVDYNSRRRSYSRDSYAPVDNFMSVPSIVDYYVQYWDKEHGDQTAKKKEIAQYADIVAGLVRNSTIRCHVQYVHEMIAGINTIKKIMEKL